MSPNVFHDRSKKSKKARDYKNVDNETRNLIIHLIHDKNLKITEASKLAGVSYENAKAINRTYRLEGRTEKKVYQRRSRFSKAQDKMHGTFTNEY